MFIIKENSLFYIEYLSLKLEFILLPDISKGYYKHPDFKSRIMAKSRHGNWDKARIPSINQSPYTVENKNK